MLNAVQFHDPFDFCFKVGTIVKDDLLWHFKSTNDVVLYELGHILDLQHGVGGCFHPFSEVVNCDSDVLVPI